MQIIIALIEKVILCSIRIAVDIHLNLTIIAVILSVPILSAVDVAHNSSNKCSTGGQKLFGFGFNSFM